MDEVIEEIGGVNSPDFTELESNIKSLVETIEKDIEIKEQEKIEQQEKEKKALEEGLKSEEKIKETETFESEYKTTMVSIQENQATGIEDLISEVQVLNGNTLSLIERMDNQNEIIIEGFLTLIISIVIAFSIKIFIDQITKW